MRAIPDSGWFLDGHYERDGKLDYGSRMKAMYSMINAVSGLAKKCTDAEGHKCLFAPTAVKYVKTPVFALNSEYDASMGKGPYGTDGGVYDCGWGYSPPPHVGLRCNASSVNQFGQYIVAMMKAALVPPHGAWLDSCYRHCSINCVGYDIQIGGVRAAQAVRDWYVGLGGGVSTQAKRFPCLDCCN